MPSALEHGAGNEKPRREGSQETEIDGPGGARFSQEDEAVSRMRAVNWAPSKLTISTDTPRSIERAESRGQQILRVRPIFPGDWRIRQGPLVMPQLPGVRDRCPQEQYLGMPPQTGRLESSDRICNSGLRCAGQTNAKEVANRNSHRRRS